MQEEFDYVMALKTQSMGDAEMTGLLRGVFIGTKKYMFFIPYEGYSATERMQETLTITMEGMTMGDFLSHKVNESRMSISDFERYMLGVFYEEMPQMHVLSLADDCQQIKVKAGWFSSSVFYNQSNKSIGGWILFVHSLGKDKKKVRSFYENHPKLDK